MVQSYNPYMNNLLDNMPQPAGGTPQRSAKARGNPFRRWNLIQEQTKGMASMNYVMSGGMGSPGMGLSGASSRAAAGAANTGTHNQFLQKKYDKRMGDIWFKRGQKLGGAMVDAPVAAAKGISKAAHRFGTSRGVNAASKLAFGASVPQIAAAGAVGLGLYAALSDNPVQGARSAAGFVTTMGEQMKQASRPSYGTTVFNQSTQGLVFGLHSRRNR